MKYKILVYLIFATTQIQGQVPSKQIQWFNTYIKDKGLDNKEYKNELNDLDFSSLFLKTPSAKIYGVIGDHMQRIQIKWVSFRKNLNNPDIYNVSGKSKVKNNVCDLTGFLKIKSIQLYHEGRYDMPYNIKIEPQMIGVLFCDYVLTEQKDQKHSGVFKGISATEFYINNDTLFYNESEADEMTNNQFVGEWISNATNKSITCNWGDYRVPNIEGFDCGAAEFAPCEKCIKNGWMDCYKANIENDPAATIREHYEWWK